MTISGVAGSSQAVTFTAPTVSGGAPPVQTNCNPASGQSFPLGSTTVTCTATDASSRSATCSFNVQLKGYSISVTRYAAYGDSLTEGQNGLPSGGGYVPMFVDTPNSYPTKLQQDFEAQFPGQGIVVINRGHGGATVETTVQEIRDLLPIDKPQAVLVLSGYNDLGPCGGFASGGKPLSTACRSAITDVGFGVRDCIRRVKESGLGIPSSYVFVSTLTPPGPYIPTPGVFDRRANPDAIVAANDAIRRQVAAERATLVDTYPTFLGHEADYTDADGLHLRPPGYQALADGFFGVITTTVPQTPLVAGRRPFP